jgi:hypothetical protein
MGFTQEETWQLKAISGLPYPHYGVHEVTLPLALYYGS